MKPLILISNDDGYTSRGLAVLIEALKPLGDLFVIAPDSARSGASMSITSMVPVSCKREFYEEGLTIYSCTGTPADCAKLAIDQLLMRQPDFVASGINFGTNASVNFHYSGTTAVATEAALHGIPAVAFSSLVTDPKADLSHLAPYVQHIAHLAMQNGMPFGTYLNVNFPDTEEFSGILGTRMAFSRWIDEFEPCTRNRGGHYYWLSGENVNDEPDDDSTDLWALEHDYIAITPIKIDATDHDFADKLNDWDL